VKAWVAHAEATQLVGPPPPPVELVVWDGRAPAPTDGLEDVALFVPPTWNKAAALDVLPRLSGLQVIQLLSAGADWILPHVPPGVVLCDAAGVHDPAVAEWVVATTLALLRRADDFVRQQARSSSESGTSETLHGKRVLIVGYGSIGRALEPLLLAFGAQVDRVARRPRDGVHAVDRLPELLPTADIVVLLLPLTDGTRGLVDAAFLAAMPDAAVLVNAARGAVVDTEALTREVSRGRLRAVLDVVDPEPLPPQHPLWSLPGVLLTPHVAAYTPTWLPRVYALVCRQLTHLVDGTSLENQVVDGY
jgi:phosphoglycerate dehydrogenase-like enzyme